MVKLLADENFLLPTVNHLRKQHYDILTLLDLGKAGQAIPDDEVLQLATMRERCLVNLNRKDFIKLHNQSANHAGIIVCTVDADFEALANRIITCLETTEPLLDGQLLRVQRVPV